jgi:hypothetical protein
MSSPSDSDRPDRSRDNEAGDVAPDAPPSEAEIAAAAALRRALERGAPDAPGDADWEMLQAIRAGANPAALSDERHRVVLARALSADRPRGKVIYFAFGGVGTLAAMAAAFALIYRVVTRDYREAAPPMALSRSMAEPVAVSRSTADLFPDGIPAKGGTSDRVDRIAYARARDLRENRFNRWGVH